MLIVSYISPKNLHKSLSIQSFAQKTTFSRNPISLWQMYLWRLSIDLWHGINRIMVWIGQSNGPPPSQNFFCSTVTLPNNVRTPWVENHTKLVIPIRKIATYFTGFRVGSESFQSILFQSCSPEETPRQECIDIILEWIKIFQSLHIIVQSSSLLIFYSSERVEGELPNMGLVVKSTNNDMVVVYLLRCKG